jgi:SAM-dependent methyltransferase
METAAHSMPDLEVIPCIFGHGFNEEVAIEENGFKGRRCRSCGLIYISPRPRREEVFDLYHHDKAHLPSAHHLQAKPDATLAAAHHLRILRRLRLPPASILEIGCGGGHFLKAAKEAGYEPYGIELNPFQAEHVRTKLGIACETQPFSESSFGGRKFDVIYHVDVTSHLPDPIQDFSVMRQKLASGGVLLFETGNGADVDRKFYRYFNLFQYPDHLFFFGRSTVIELLVRAGFRLTDIQIRAYSILPTLKLTSFLRNRNRRARCSESGKVCRIEPHDASRFAPSGAVWKANLFHWLKYGLGRWVGKESHPMTFLISTRKRT